MLDVWMAFLKNPLNGDIQEVPEVQKALDTLKEISANEEEREIYNLRQQTEFGYISEKNVAVINAKAEGEKIGIEKERAKAELEKKELVNKTAKNLLAMNLSVEQISQATGLSISEIEDLKT